ncbi:MAG: DMT family transporter [Alphaproteobacteria bacterium]|nr:MAG: DMT family transporter [Alphaproteobacteria bacterium]
MDPGGAERRASLAFLALLTGAVGIGFAPIFVRVAEVGPLASAFWRMALALPPLIFWRALQTARARRHESRSERRPVCSRQGSPIRGDLVLLVGCGLFFAADLGLWHWSIRLTTVANATLLANLNPVFVALVGFLFLGHRFRPLFLLGMASALAGAAALMGASLEVSPERLLGDALGIATAVMYAGYFLTTARLRSRHDTWTVLSFSILVTALALWPLALASPEPMLPRDLVGWWPLIGLALVSQIGGQGLIVHALAHLPPAFSAVSLLLQPVVAALAAWALFGEALGPLEGFGALLVLGGIVLARIATRVR